MKKWMISALCFNFLLLTGNLIIVSCETSNASGTINASDVVFDNTGTGLLATTLQGAIAELAGRVNEVRAGEISALLVGTWSGVEKDEDPLDRDYNSSVSVTLNSNGTYSCTTFGRLSTPVCAAPVSWGVNGRILEITYTVPEGWSASGKIELPIHHASGSELILLDGSDDFGMRVMFLSKS